MYILSYSDCFSPVGIITLINDLSLMIEYINYAQWKYN